MEGIQRLNGKISPKKMQYGNGVTLMVGYGRNYSAQNYLQYRSVRNPRLDEPTENMVGVKNKFANTIKAIATAKQNPTQWDAYKREFASQTKYKTLNGFVFAKLFPEASALPNS